MRRIGYVNSEAGALIIADIQSGQKWPGEMPAQHRAEVSRIFESLERYQQGNDSWLAWDMGGAGTAFVFATDLGEIILVRGWFEDVSEEIADSTLVDAATKARFGDVVGTLAVTSGKLGVTWFFQPGAVFSRDHFGGAWRISERELETGGAALIIDFPCDVALLTTSATSNAFGDYVCLCIVPRSFAIQALETGRESHADDERISHDPDTHDAFVSMETVADENQLTLDL